MHTHTPGIVIFCLFSSSVSVDPSGNGTCAISTRIPTLQDLETHTDYDVYVKTRRGSPWCNVDRLYQDFTLGNGTGLMKIGRPNKEGTVTNIYGNSYSKSVCQMLSRRYTYAMLSTVLILILTVATHNSLHT